MSWATSRSRRPGSSLSSAEHEPEPSGRRGAEWLKAASRSSRSPPSCSRLRAAGRQAGATCTKCRSRGGGGLGVPSPGTDPSLQEAEGREGEAAGGEGHAPAVAVLQALQLQ